MSAAKRKLPVDFSGFREWREPAELRDKVEQIVAQLERTPDFGEFAMLTNSGMNELLEAATASQFGLIFEKFNPDTLVRLGVAPQPDFALKVESERMWFESTETDMPGRKRGLEYQGLRQVPKASRELVQVDENGLQAEHDAFERVLPERVKDKAQAVRSKKYVDDGKVIAPNLVVRVNLDHRHAPDKCADLVADYKDVFPSIWLMEPDARLVRLWPAVLELKCTGGLADLYPP